MCVLSVRVEVKGYDVALGDVPTADRCRGSTLLVVFVVDTFRPHFSLVNCSTFTINHIVYREHVQLQRPVGREGGLWQCFGTSDPLFVS